MTVKKPTPKAELHIKKIDESMFITVGSYDALEFMRDCQSYFELYAEWTFESPPPLPLSIHAIVSPLYDAGDVLTYLKEAYSGGVVCDVVR